MTHPTLIEPLEARIAPATFTVNTLADTGAGSFRQAILDANAASGADSITFDLGGSGPHIISPLSALPSITDKVEISVTSTDSLEIVRIDGALAGPNAVGLRFVGTTGSSATGIQVAHFSGDGILLENSTATVLKSIQSFGNGGSGIHMVGSDQNSVLSSAAGTFAADPTSTGNALHGLFLENSIQNTFGTAAVANNFFNGNGTSGVTIIGGYENAFVGFQMKSNGAAPVGSSVSGGLIVVNSSYNRFFGYIKLPVNIGFPQPTYIGALAREITDNFGHGILLTGSDTFSNSLYYGLVTDNTGDGLRVEAGAHDLILGDTVSTTNTNGGKPFVLTESVGSSFLRNDGWGIRMENGGSNSKITANTASQNGLGGVLAAGVQRVVIDSNKFEANEGPGIAAVGASQGIELKRNSFSANTGLPFDLGADGITANDVGDADIGPNGLLNAPAFTPMGASWHSVIDTDRPNTQLRLEYYKYVASTQSYTFSTEGLFTTDANGDVEISVSVHGDEQIVVRVNVVDGDSSEFSNPTSDLPEISLTPTTVSPIVEGNSGTKDVAFKVQLDAPSLMPVTVQYSTVAVTATAGEDYVPISGTITFAPGVTEMPLVVTISGDTQKEASETFRLELTNPTVGYLSSSASATTLTIANDDNIPTVSIGDVVAAEPAGTDGTFGTVQFPVTLSEASLDPVTIKISAATAPAFPERNYSLETTTITFQPGQTTAVGTLRVVRDSVQEPNQLVSLTLSNPENATLGDSNGSITIVDDDSWGLTLGDVTITEGNNGTAIAHVPVTIAALVPTPTARPIQFDYATANQTATAGSDYTSTTGSFSFENGPATAVIDIPISGDLNLETDEIFQVLAQNVLGARVLHESTVTITNDDTPPPQISIGDVTIVEGDDGTANAVFTVSLNVAGDQEIQVHYQTANGTATAGSDYTAAMGDLVFPVGVTTRTITVPIVGDVTDESNETFLVNLTNPQNATLADAQAEGTITDNDTDPVLSIGDVTIVEGNNGTTNAVFTVSLNIAGKQEVQVHYQTANGTATSGNDYTAVSGDLVFPVGVTTRTITVPIIGDTLYEGDHSFVVQLSDPQKASLGDGTASGTITDDDLPTLSIADTAVVEGDSGTSNAVFTVTLSAAFATAVTVNYTTVPGTALASQDYTTTTGTLTFAAGETTKTINVPIIGDLAVESAETFSVSLSNATSATIARGEAVATISDTDLPGPQLTISNNHKVATWRDVDGDLVTLRANLPVLSPDSFDFTSAGQGGQLTDFHAVGAVAGVPINLSFTAAKTTEFPAGDGIVNVGRIDLSGLTAGAVIVSGDLGSVLAGTPNARGPLSIATLNVGSLGAVSGNGPLESILGKVGKIIVHGEWGNAALSASVATQIKIVGGIHSTATGVGEPDPGIYLSGKLGKLIVSGGIEGASTDNPFVIKTNGNRPGETAAGSMALDSLVVTGDVVNTWIVAGTSADGATANTGARIGTVMVTGNWTGSNLVAGASFGADQQFGTADDVVGTGTGLISRIASITITGSISATAAPNDHFGFVAEKISRLSVGGTAITLNPLTPDTAHLSSDTTLREVARA